MARIRTIKPEFWMDEDLAEVSEAALILAVGLLNYADDEGYFRANPALIKAWIFPLREPSVSIHGALTELSNKGYLRLFSGSNGKQFGKIVGFEKHQRINRPTPSKIKELEILTEDSLSPHGGLTIGKERKGKEKEAPPPAGALSSADLWRDIKAAGVPSKVLGMLAKTHGTEAMEAAVAKTLQVAPADAKSYLIGLLKPKPDIFAGGI